MTHFHRLLVILATTMAISSAVLVGVTSTAGAAGPDAPPGPGVTVVVSCLENNGRIDVNIVNLGSTAAEYELHYGALSRRVIRVPADDWGRFSITGRIDGYERVSVRRNGELALDTVVRVLCDDRELIVGDSRIEGPEVAIVNGCRFDRGYLLVQLLNDRPEPQPYVITFDEGRIPNRSTTAAAFGAGVRAITGRPDGVYPIQVRSGGEIVYEGTVTVACNPSSDDRANTSQRIATLPQGVDPAPNIVDSSVPFGTELVGSWLGSVGSITGLADGRLVATSGSRYYVHDAVDPLSRVEHQLPEPALQAEHLVALRDGRVAGADGSAIRVFDPDDPINMLSIETPDRIFDLAVLADGRVVALTAGALHVWNDIGEPPIAIDLTRYVSGGDIEGQIAVMEEGWMLASFGQTPVLLIDPGFPDDVEVLLGEGQELAGGGVGSVPSAGLGLANQFDRIVAWNYAAPFSEGLTLPDSATFSYRDVVGLDDGSIAAIDGRGHIDLWSPPYNDAPRRLDGALGSDLTALPGGRLASTNNSGGILQLWDPSITTGDRFEGHSTTVTALATLPDGRIVTGDSSGDLLIWDRAAMHTPGLIENNYLPIDVVNPAIAAIEPMSQDRVAISALGAVRILDLNDSSNLQQFRSGDWRPDELVANVSGLLGGYDRSRLVVMDPDDNPDLAFGRRLVADLSGEFADLDVFADGRFVFVDNGTARILDPSDGSLEDMAVPEGLVVTKASVLADGRVVLTGRALRLTFVIVDPSGAVDAVEVEGSFIGQRDDELLVVGRTGTGSVALVDLSNPADEVGRVHLPVGASNIQVRAKRLLVTFGKGWVLFE